DRDFVYWVSYGTPATDFKAHSDGRVERVTKDGSRRETLASGLSGPYGLALDEQFVYFSETGLAIGNRSAGVRRISKSVGSIVHLYEGGVGRVVVTDSELFLLTENYDRLKTEIRRMPKSGGTARRIVDDRLVIHSNMVVFDKRLYYTTIQRLGAIASVTLDGRARVVHLDAGINSDNFLVDGCAIYVATPVQYLWRIAR
ncbi:MAG TPA: hypothetical protein VHL58_06265, partial [Thermoanaerobaculia bacterium]|nr:hypothetical protein [Thermoanaerobaculia bacterium]